MNGYTFSPMDTDELAQKMNDVLKIEAPPCATDKVRKNRMLMGYGEYMKELVERLKVRGER